MSRLWRRPSGEFIQFQQERDVGEQADVQDDVGYDAKTHSRLDLKQTPFNQRI